jgi:hypothetical protein
MDLKLAEALVQVCEDEGLDVSLRESYNGRGMYDKTTAGVVINGGDVQDILIAVINNATCFIAEENDPVEFFDLSEMFTVHNLRVDNMGKGIILY